MMIELEREKEAYGVVSCAGPNPDIETNMKPEDDEHRHRNEHQGTFWIFAWTELIPWPHKIVPLFSPCGGRGWEVGDFWGVDEQGQLLVIETKTKANRESPFNKFADHHAPPLDVLRNHWLRRLSQEKAFRQAHPHGLGCEKPLQSWPGLLDSSVGRMECRRYRRVYLECIAPRVDSGEYELVAQRNLDRYVETGCPSPHYLGLFTLFDRDEVPRYVDDHNLISKVGKDHVHAFAVQRCPFLCYSPKECEIRSYRVQVRH
jgi:hypothetical protein